MIYGNPKAFIQDILAHAILDALTSGVYCKQHREKLIHLRYIDNNGDKIEIGYCPKCRKEYCEYSDISPIYISNYEWLYGDE